MDEESTEVAGELFGHDSEHTIGTGPFVLKKWNAHEGMLLTANKNCWSGAPNCDGLDMRFVTEPEEIRTMFEQGELDILDLDDVGSSAEFFLHGDIYQDRLYQVPRIGITYLALNETVEPLGDARVRKALQLSLNRPVLLDAVYAGLGSIENGIYPHGLVGYNPKLPDIEFDPDEAKELLKEAGYPKGFDLTISVKASSTQWEMTLVRLAASMWKDLGIQTSVKVMSEDDFMAARKGGKLACYTAMWTADFDDPDNFIYTFFGNRENTTFRSLCYQRDDIMKRVRNARTIMDPEKRIREYQDLERIIVQEDAAWVPLFSRLRTYVMSERIEGVQSSWNGSVKNRYRDITITETL
jgi:ABC-type transport system substrate-binding protein